MRVAFIQKDPLPHPLLMSLGAAVVFRGHQARVFIPAAERDLKRAIGRYAPAAVVFAPPSGFHQWALNQARVLKQSTGGAPMLFTGAHATDHRDFAREHGCDVVMTGDPETTLPEVLAKIHKERALPGTSGTVAWGSDGPIIGPPRAMVDDLDQLPLPDIEIYRRYPFIQQQTTLGFAVGRGVLENTHAGFQIGLEELARRFQPARKHSVEEAIARILLLRQRRPFYRRVAFRDDSLLLDRVHWLPQFLERYGREVSLPFSCLARADHLDTETVERLAEAGCKLVKLCIESGDPGLREGVVGSPVSDNDILDSVDRLRTHNIGVQTLSFIGLPNETFETALRTLDLNIRIAPDHAFALGVCQDEGQATSQEIEQLRDLLPVTVRFPSLRPMTTWAARQGPSTLHRRIFQWHHDASFVTSGELAMRDIARIATSMKRSRGEALSSP
ncbi:MAG TPA: hypothetical protein DIU15_08700 [Deltaproteobacteria bacterium]|nr:hypothetical protein [Deltaproteobacteria bacterium]HCP46106.1 hypothetical protein [Deltaproteobacteria bacterium]